MFFVQNMAKDTGDHSVKKQMPWQANRQHKRTRLTLRFKNAYFMYRPPRWRSLETDRERGAGHTRWVYATAAC